MTAFTRSLHALLNVFYCICIIAFYSTCFVALVNARSSLADNLAINDRNESYYVLLLCNTMKPLAWLVILYYDTRYFFGTLDSLVAGGVTMIVFFFTLALEITLTLEKEIHCNSPNVHFNNPCNDVLYCCVYQDNPTCTPYFGNNPATRCIFKNLPPSLQSDLVSADTSITWLNNTALNKGNVKLSPDFLFIVCFWINTVVLLVEAVLFFFFVKKVVNKVSASTRGDIVSVEKNYKDEAYDRSDYRLVSKKAETSTEGYEKLDESDTVIGEFDEATAAATEDTKPVSYGARMVKRFTNLKIAKIKNGVSTLWIKIAAGARRATEWCKNFGNAILFSDPETQTSSSDRTRRKKLKKQKRLERTQGKESKKKDKNRYRNEDDDDDTNGEFAGYNTASTTTTTTPKIETGRMMVRRNNKYRQQ